MELRLHRKWRKDGYSIGRLFVNDEFFCNTVEDTDRGLTSEMTTKEIESKKVFGQTAIPYGRYEITLKVQSGTFKDKKAYQSIKGYLPRLKNVKGYSGVLIHIGNFPKDTNGCILVGENKVKGGVCNSTVWFWKLYEILKAASENGEKIWITVEP